jgi:hypothetical protein
VFSKFYIYFEAGPYYVSLAGLELRIILLSAGIRGINQYAQLNTYLLYTQESQFHAKIWGSA